MKYRPLSGFVSSELVAAYSGVIAPIGVGYMNKFYRISRVSFVSKYQNPLENGTRIASNFLNVKWTQLKNYSFDASRMK